MGGTGSLDVSCVEVAVGAAWGPCPDVEHGMRGSHAAEVVMVDLHCMTDLVFVTEEGNCLNRRLNYFPGPLELVEEVGQALAGNRGVRYMECCCR